VSAGLFCCVLRAGIEPTRFTVAVQVVIILFAKSKIKGNLLQ
jgi:hypothetical protein